MIKLKDRNIFLIDILDNPLKIRDRSSANGIKKENYDLLISGVHGLKDKIKERSIYISEDRIVFLLARTSYKKELKREFPNAQYFSWIDFRLGRE